MIKNHIIFQLFLICRGKINAVVGRKSSKNPFGSLQVLVNAKVEQIRKNEESLNGEESVLDKMIDNLIETYKKRDTLSPLSESVTKNTIITNSAATRKTMLSERYVCSLFKFLDKIIYTFLIK